MPRTRSLVALAVTACLPLGCVVPVPVAGPAPSPSASAPVAAGVVATGQVPGQLGTIAAIGPSSVTLNVGENRALAPLFRMTLGGRPTPATEGVVWFSSAEGVVKVNPTTGQATAISKGTAQVVVALSADPTVRAELHVTVGDGLGVKEVRLTPAEGKLVKGKTLKLQAEVVFHTGEIASDVTWSTSDPAIATVAQDGTVTGVGPGLVQVLATWKKDPAFKGQAPVRVVSTEDELFLAVASPSPSPTATPDAEPGSWIDQASGVTAGLNHVQFFDTNKGVASGPGVFLHTADGGATWTKAAADPALDNPLSVDFQGPESGWVVTPAAIHRISTTGEMAPLVAFEITHAQRLAAVVRQGAQQAFALTDKGAIFATTDGGATWTEAHAATATSGDPAPAAYSVQTYNFANGYGFGPLVVAGGKLLFQRAHTYTTKNWQTNAYYNVTAYTLHHNMDGGWAKSTLTTGITTMVFPSAQEGWRMKGQLERTVDGGKTWVAVDHNQNLRTIGLQWIEATDTKTIRVGGKGGYILTRDGGRSWHTEEVSGATFGDLAVVDASHMWAVGGSGQIKRYVLTP